jgi:HD-like signal output (HDOD) protein
LKVETSQLERLLDPQGNCGINVAESLQNSHNDDAGGIEAQLYCDIYRAVVRDALVLPSLPEVAIKIRKLLENEDVSTKQLAQVVQTDSSIAAKLVKAANSALYAGATTVDSVSQALVRLGMKTTSELVLCYAISELFQTQSKLLQSRMQSLWRHSAHVAAISFVLAQKTGCFDPERALLMGLLHDVGILPILSYLDKYPEAANAPQQVEQAIRALRGEIGNLILSKWNFPEDFGTTALESEDWGRDPRPEPDYCDLVMIAQLHSFIDTGDVLMAPPMNQIPAFRKLQLGQLTPQMGLALLDEATEQIDEVMRMLSL